MLLFVNKKDISQRFYLGFGLTWISCHTVGTRLVKQYQKCVGGGGVVDCKDDADQEDDRVRNSWRSKIGEATS